MDANILKAAKLMLDYLIIEQEKADIEFQKRSAMDSFDPIEIGLRKAMEVRSERRTKYGDAFLEDKPDFLISQIENKIKRFKVNDGDLYESQIDNAVDMSVYSLFLLTNLIIENDKVINAPIVGEGQASDKK